MPIAKIVSARIRKSEDPSRLLPGLGQQFGQLRQFAFRELAQVLPAKDEGLLDLAINPSFGLAARTASAWADGARCP